MERLHFGSDSTYDALEAAVHLSRYLLVKTLCKGRRVLDVACGEGYGTHLMALWGASSVDGVDRSAEAIASANATFVMPNVRFRTGRCENLVSVVDGGTYDLVVSLETLEHVDDLDAYLDNLRAVAGESGTIVISCPNDHWFYKHGVGNPFHKRRLTLQEFKAQTEQHLGPASSWHQGTLGIGFAVTREGSLPPNRPGDPQELMLSCRELDAAVLSPPQIESAPADEELAFYMGVWGSDASVDALFSGYPVSMELSREPLFPHEGRWAVKKSSAVIEREQGWEARVRELENRLAQSERDLRRARLGLKAVDVENKAMRDGVWRLRTRTTALETELSACQALLATIPWRTIAVYRRLRRIVPDPLLKGAAAVVDRYREKNARNG